MTINTNTKVVLTWNFFLEYLNKILKLLILFCIFCISLSLSMVVASIFSLVFSAYLLIISPFFCLGLGLLTTEYLVKFINSILPHTDLIAMNSMSELNSISIFILQLISTLSISVFISPLVLLLGIVTTIPFLTATLSIGFSLGITMRLARSFQLYQQHHLVDDPRIAAINQSYAQELFLNPNLQPKERADLLERYSKNNPDSFLIELLSKLTIEEHNNVFNCLSENLRTKLTVDKYGDIPHPSYHAIS